MAFNAVSFSAAQALEAPQPQAAKAELKANIGELPNKPPKEKFELKSKRTEYSTRYLNPDGSFTKEIFLEKKFYKDTSDKKWKKVNNNLKASNTRAGKVENTSNDFRVFFSEQQATGEIATVEKDGKSIGMIPVGAKNTTGVKKDNEILYKNIYPETDIRYEVQGSKVKEDIILNSYTGQNIFSYELKLKGLNAVAENGIIYFTDNKGNKIWRFEKPFMTDANEKYSDKVNLVLRKENNRIFVDVAADKTFLEDPSTQYPVIIDPTIDPDTVDVIRDTFVASYFPASSYSNLTKFYTGADPYYYGTMRSFVQFVLPSLPSDSKILSANFKAYQTAQDNTSVSIDLHRLTSSWTGSITWNAQPTTTYVYDFNNAVTQVTDGEGRRIDYLHNPNKNIVQIIENPLDPQNRAVTTFSYNDKNELTEVIDANTNKINETANPKIQSYYVFEYDDNGNITGVQISMTKMID